MFPATGIPQPLFLCFRKRLETILFDRGDSLGYVGIASDKSFLKWHYINLQLQNYSLVNCSSAYAGSLRSVSFSFVLPTFC